LEYSSEDDEERPVNFYWRQTIVGLLRNAADHIPQVAERTRLVAAQLDRTLTSDWLERAFALFQEATLLSRDPIYVTGAYYTMQALGEVGRWEEQAGSTIQVMIDRSISPESTGGRIGGRVGPEEPGTDRSFHQSPRPGADGKDEVHDEVEQGLLELFDRIRQGATLDEALALFPQIGDESAPDDDQQTADEGGDAEP
jgi:hypothetical protein